MTGPQDELACAGTNLTAPLEEQFDNPPSSARPRTWWHWMNGNVTRDGIRKDLEWMASIGLGGIHNFDANLQTPQIVDSRLVYMTPEWMDAFRFAASEAKRHCFEMAIASSPGWSETGGPWVGPADGMKKLVWSETILEPGSERAKLAVPPVITGPFQTMAAGEFAEFTDDTGRTRPVAWGRVAVMAVPVSEPEAPQPTGLREDGRPVDARLLSDADLEKGIELSREDSVRLLLVYPEKVTVRSARIFVPGAKPTFGMANFYGVLEAWDGAGWRDVAKLPLSSVPLTASFPAVTSARFRLRFDDDPGAGWPSVVSPVAGAALPAPPPEGAARSVVLADFRLSGEGRLSRAEEKAGFAFVPDYYEIETRSSASTAVAPSDVIDLSGRVAADGTLDWTPPDGRSWRIFSFGWSLTGKTNHPATAEATGLEVDKYDAAAVRRYIQAYLALYRRFLGQELMGESGLNALLTDSIEVGAANWTPALMDEFERRRGYSMRPWLPALAGVVIGSPEQTEKFLFDFRSVLAELLAVSHYATIAAVAHDNGLKVYGEALESVRPVLGDDLAMRRYADVPMAALWAWQRDRQPSGMLLGDMKGAASVSHVYGQNLVAAESMTSGYSPWAFAPRDLKRIVDLQFAYGVNLPVIHTSVHVPVDDKKPGLSLMIFGQMFNRNETWATMAKPWIDYIARSAFMLQQGRHFADVAVFSGEEAPLTAQFRNGVPSTLPTRYAYDFVNADMLREKLRVEDGMLVAESGAKYAALYVGSGQRMTLPTLKRIAGLVDQGATLLGEKPVGSPSLGDDAAEFSALASTLWSHQGAVAVSDVEAGLARIGLQPDFAYSAPSEDAEILFLHRRLENGDVYFLTNRRNRSEQIEARFRVSGKRPELWDAMTGHVEPLSYRFEDGSTVIALELDPEDAKFVVFLHDAASPSATIARRTEQTLAILDGPWEVTFEQGRGAPAGAAMPRLRRLDQFGDPGIKYFSGVTTYRSRFSMPRALQQGEQLWLDLGEVGDVAQVLVNGHNAGIAWFAPNRVEISSFVRRGNNEVEVRVANLWVNRLIGDAQSPSGADHVTYTAQPTYRPDAPLRPSGLSGPVALISSK